MSLVKTEKKEYALCFKGSLFPQFNILVICNGTINYDNKSVYTWNFHGSSISTYNKLQETCPSLKSRFLKK